MFDMLFYNLFDTEVIYYEYEGAGTCVLPQQTRSQMSWGIAMWCQEFLCQFVDKITCFSQPINGFVALNAHVAVVYNVHKNVLVDDFLWDQIYGDADRLVICWILKQCPQIVIFNVRSHETGSWCGNRAVQQHLNGCYVYGGCTLSDISVQEVTAYFQPCPFLFLFLWAVYYHKFSISDFISLWYMGTADEMDVFCYLDKAYNALHWASEFIGTRLCPYVFVFF